jgi:integrase
VTREDPDGSLLAYRQLQHAYNEAFKAAGLPFRSTHILRHGGARLLYNRTRGDLEVAKQQLGNADLQSVLTYAKRSASAFTASSDEQWEIAEAAAGGGRKVVANGTRLRLVREYQGE